MNSSELLILIFVCFISTGSVTGQLIANAGNDTAYCAEGQQERILGGNPTAIGGVPPYTYTWSAKYQWRDHIWYASSMLDDTTLANPMIKLGAIPDSIYFYLTARDSIGNSSTDSVMVRLSQYIVCLMDCILFIKYGDSTILWSCVDGGIGPFEYSWTPANSLSDSTVRNPWAKPTSNTEYKFKITDAAGCVFESRCFVTVYPVNADELRSSISKVRLYPNPSKNINVIYAAVINEKYLNTNLELFSSDGKLIKKIRIVKTPQRIDLTDFAKGIYIYKWYLGGNVNESGTLLIK